MKKKKILSLMTAGVTAMTMLCACSENVGADESMNETTTAATTTTAPAQTTAATTTAAAAVTSEESPEDMLKRHEPVVLYDTKPISDAYLSGDRTGLDDLQVKILDKAEKVIEENITEDMDDYTKELTIHDYLITHCTYDTQALSVMETPSENSDNPYGALINGQSICSGYTTSFQMFMDMLGIPCKSVSGIDIKDEDHAWNMVEINGKWYYVDVTWDDPVPDKHTQDVLHLHFNTTEEFMKLEHIWDDSECPPCDSYDDTYIAHNITHIDDWSQVNDVIEDALSKNSLTAYIEPDESLGANMENTDTIYGSGITISNELNDIYKEQIRTNKECIVIFKRSKYKDKNVIEVYMAPKA